MVGRLFRAWLVPGACWLLILIRTVAQVPCVNGYAGAYPCDRVDLLAHLSIADLGGQVNVADLWGWTDPLTGKEYALVAMRNGTAFVDISQPTAPVLVGMLPSHIAGNNVLWRDVDVAGNWCYVGSETAGHGLQIFDLTRLRNIPAPPMTFTADAHFGGFGNSHTIHADKVHPYVYAVGTGINNGGLNVVNVADPLLPTLAGTFSQEGYIHENMVVHYNGPDTDHVGRQISFNFHSGTPDKITICDVTDKTDIETISTITYAGARISHQGWLTEDHRYLLMNDEGDEAFHGHGTRTRIFDVQDLDVPFLLGAYTATMASTDHNLYLHQQVAYEANYTSGLRLLDASQVASGILEEVAYFDTYPANDGPQYDGAWGNYPFFSSGTVIISDLSSGLFIVRPHLQLRPRVKLEGPYVEQTGLMRDDLRVLGLVPLVEPYSQLGSPPSGGSVAVPASRLQATGPEAIVDWVLVELRDVGDPALVIERRAGLLRRDGAVEANDGGTMSFTSPPGPYHVSIRHRNHLGVMTAQPIALGMAPRDLDLADPTLPLWGTEAAKVLGGTRVLWVGDGSGDGRIRYAGTGNDRDPILVAVGGSVPTATIQAYSRQDHTMDGVVKYAGSGNDRDPILVNIGGTVPTATRVAQLP